MSGIRLVRRAGLTASKIHKRQVSSARHQPPRKVVPAEIDDTIGVADRRRLCPSDTAKYCFEKYPRTCSAHPYCFSLRWRGIRLFYYTIFVANLEKFCLFFSPGLLYPLPSVPPYLPFLRLRSHFVYHHLTYPR